MVTVTQDSAPAIDGALLARTRTALGRWEREFGFGPTSTLTGGGAIEAFETRFASVCGVAHALGLPSGTLALRTALQAVGVEARTAVVIPAFDWPAAAGAVASLGARPVPADVRAGSFLIDPEAARRCFDSSTRAVVATHIAGVPADVRELQEICTGAGVPLVEDCCQALGAVAGTKPVGTIGAVGVFSLGPGKILDAGEGGVLITDDEEIYRAAVRATQHPVRQLRTGIEPDLLALAARLHPIAAITAVAELDVIAAELHRRRGRAERLRAIASPVPGVVIPSEHSGDRFSWSSVPALVDDNAQGELKRVGIDTQPLGAYDIAGLLDSPARVPNTRAAARAAVRLYEIDDVRTARTHAGTR